MYFHYDFSQKIQIIALYAWLIQPSNKIAIQLTNSIIQMEERGIQMKERAIQTPERVIHNQNKSSIYRNESSSWWYWGSGNLNAHERKRND